MKKTEENCYCRTPYYYETDRMGIVHHSNYIRWMEEARLFYMKTNGLSYSEMETHGIIMPVVSVSCQYIHSVRFDEPVEIYVKMTAFDGIRASYAYEIYLKTENRLAAKGESSHCFLDDQSRFPVNLKKKYPEFFEKGKALMEAQQ